MVIKTGGVVVAAGAFMLLAGQTAGAQESGNDAIDTDVAAAAGQQLKTDLDAGSGSLEAGDSTGSAAGTDTAGSASDTTSNGGADGGAGVDPSTGDSANTSGIQQLVNADPADNPPAADSASGSPAADGPVAGSAAASPADAGQPATAPASDGSAVQPPAADPQSAPQSAAADLVSVESSQNSAGGSQVADPAAETGGSAAGTDASDAAANVAVNPDQQVVSAGAASVNTASANTASANTASANTASANTALAGPQSNPAVGDAGTSGNWSLDLLGAGTLFSDGLSISLQLAGADTAVTSKLLNQIYSIVVNGRSSANALTIAGPLGRLLTFVGGGNDKLTLATGGNTIRFTGDRQGVATDATNSPAVTFSGVGEVVGSGSNDFIVDGPASIGSLTLNADDRLILDGSAGSDAGDLLTIQSAHLGGTLDLVGGVPGQFLTFGSVDGDFDTFRGLDQGDGGYLRPMLGTNGYQLVGSILPDGVTAAFPTTAAADDFFAAISGKQNHLAAGTQVTFQVLGQQLTGGLTVRQQTDATNLDITGARLAFGDAGSPLANFSAAGPVRLTLTPDSLTGQLVGTVSSTIPGIGFDGLFTVTLDSDAGVTTATGADVTLLVAGQRIAGVPLTLTAVLGPSGWQLRLTGPAGAVVTLGGSDGLLTAQLLGRLDLVLGPAGLQTALAVHVTLAGVPGATVDGTFDLLIDTVADDVTASATNATLTAGDTALTGALLLHPALTAAGQPAVQASFGTVSITAFGGTIALLGLVGGTFLLTRTGVVGRAAGGIELTIDGLPGSAGGVGIDVNTTGTTGPLSYLVNDVVSTIAARGPPLVIELSDVHSTVHADFGDVSLTGTVTITSTNSTTILQASGFALVLTDSGFASAPAAWQVELDSQHDHLISIGSDGADIVVTVDGVSTRRATQFVTGVTITATGNTNDTLQLGVVPVPVDFAAGGGTDVINGPSADTLWHITGAGAGSVNSLTFSGVEKLIGAAGNQDVFAFTPGGFLALGVDGGPGGFDTMRFDAPNGSVVDAVGYRPSGIDSGYVDFGNASIAFAGLEPVSNSVTAVDVVVTYTDPSDELTVSTDGVTGHVVITASKAEQFDFALPTGSVTINAGGAKLTFAAVNFGTASITVNSAGQIIVGANLTAKAISLYALRNITVNNGVQVAAATGDLTLGVIAEANATWTAGTVPFFRDVVAEGSLNIQAGAHLTGANVFVTVTATTAKFAIFDLDELNLDPSSTALTPSMALDSFPTFTPGQNSGDVGTITRRTGSWIADGFTADSYIRVVNSTSNDGFWHITAITATTLTVDPATVLTAEAGNSDVTIEGVYLNEGDPALTFAGQSITRATGSWIADGFVVGQTANIQSNPDASGVNDNGLTVLAVTDTTLTLDTGATPFTPQNGVTGIIVFAQGNPAALPLAEIDPVHSLSNATVGLTFASAGATSGTITRATGDWGTQGFAVGQLVVVGAGSANAGSYWVTGVSASLLTVATDAAFTAESNITGVEITGAALLNTQTPTAEVPVLTFAGNTVTRGSGDWIADGFTVGQAVQIQQSPANNGWYRIGAITATTITLQTVTGGAVTLVAGTTSGSPTDVTVSTSVTLLHPNLTFGGSTLARDSGSWTTDGFAVGDAIRVSGGITANAGQYRIGAISADGRTLTLTLNAGQSLTSEVMTATNVQRIMSASETGGTATEGSFTDSVKQFFDGNGLNSMLNFLVKVAKAKATSALTIADGATIEATGNLTVSSTATSTISFYTLSLLLGFSYAEGTAAATVDIGAATLNSAGDLTVSSQVNNTVDATTMIMNGITGLLFKVTSPIGKAITGPAITVTLGFATSTSATTVGAGSLLQGANVKITAKNTNTFNTSASSSVFGVKEKNTGIGIAVAVANYTSTAAVTVAGTVRGTTSVTFDSRSINTKADATAYATLSASPYLPAPQKVKNLFNSLAGKLKLNLDPTAQASDISAAAGVTVVTSVNTATLTVLGTALVGSGGALTASSYAADNFIAVAVASATLSSSKFTSGGSIAKFSVSGGVVVADHSNTATTTVADGSRLTAAGLLTVSADAEVPNQLRILQLIQTLKTNPFTPPAQPVTDTTDPVANGTAVNNGVTQANDTGTSMPAAVANYLAALVGLLNILKTIPQQIATTTVASHAGGTSTDQDGNETARTSFALSGTVMVLTVSNLASAVVAAAQLNTAAAADPGFAVKANADQAIAVTAIAHAQSIHVSGIYSPLDLLLFVLGNDAQGKVGIGGNYHGLTWITGADAHIAKGAAITAKGAVSVTSDNRTLIVAYTQQVADTTKVGIVGAFTLLRYTATSLAYIEDGALVSIGGNLLIDAGNDLLAVMVSAVFERGGQVSVGAGVSINAIVNTTRAFIGKVDGTPAAPATGTTVETGGAITIKAHSSTLLVAVGSAARVPGANSDGTQVGPAPPGPGAAGPLGPPNPPVYGFGLSGSVGVTFLADTTQAYLDAPDTVTAGGPLTIDATTKATAVTVALAVLASQIGGLTLAGAFVWNEFSGQQFGGAETPDGRRVTVAWLAAKTVTAGSVSVTATTDDTIVAVSGGLGLSLPTSTPPAGGPPTTVNLAGSAVVNRLLTTSTAEIRAGTKVTTAGDVAIAASRTLSIVAVAGAIVIRGTAAVGAGVEVDIVDDKVAAAVGDNAIIDAGGNVSVVAIGVQHIVSVAAALAVWADAVALPVTVNVQVLTADVRATVGKGAKITAGLHFSVTAAFAGPEVIVAGSGAFVAPGRTDGFTAGIGLAVALVQASRTVAALIDDGASVTQGRKLTGTTPPLVIDGRSVTGIDVYASADDPIVVVAAAGAGSGGGGGPTADLALSPAVILLTTTASARTGSVALDGSKVTVTAISSPSLYAIAVSLSIAINSGSTGGGAGNRGPPGPATVANAKTAVAGAASGAVNIINGTAEFNGLTAQAIIGGGTVKSSSAVIVTATDSASVTGDAGGLAIAYAERHERGVAGSFGVAFASNEISTKVTASISDATVTATGDLEVLATSTPVIFALTLAGTLAAGSGGQGAGTTITIAGAGAGSRNAVSLTVTAQLVSVQATIGGSVQVSATNDAQIRAIAGGFAISAAIAAANGSFVSLAVGLSVALNEISGSVTATLDPSTVTAGGAAGVVVEAITGGTIEALTMGGAASGSGSGSGAGSGNTIALSVTATIADSSVTASDGPVRVEARDTSAIRADAGGVAIALALVGDPQKLTLNAAIGVVAAINYISNTIAASVTTSTVRGAGVSVLATSLATIRALTLSGTAAVQTSRTTAVHWPARSAVPARDRATRSTTRSRPWCRAPRPSPPPAGMSSSRRRCPPLPTAPPPSTPAPTAWPSPCR